MSVKILKRAVVKEELVAITGDFILALTLPTAKAGGYKGFLNIKNALY